MSCCHSEKELSVVATLQHYRALAVKQEKWEIRGKRLEQHAVAGNHGKRRAPRGRVQECRRQTQESARAPEGHNAEPAGRAQRLETTGV